MIGRYVNTLTVGQEDRVLTSHMEPFATDTRKRMRLPFNRTCGCLIMTANAVKLWQPQTDAAREAGFRYEDLCERFGIERVNAAIRNRVLRNRARRALVEIGATGATV